MLINMSVKMKVALIFCAAFILYTPIKDAIQFSSTFLQSSSVELVDISFGNSSPWHQPVHNQLNQPNHPHFVKVANPLSVAQPLNGPQIIYTRFKVSNPNNTTETFKNIWLTFKHENGITGYTTDYSLYNAQTRQKLIGNRVQLAPNSEIELLASYRFIPSYVDSKPISIQVSWEGKKQLRHSGCELNFAKLSENNFGNQCK
ncbi:hypothetical protein CBF23_000230 [Marinomonas agarivorans]|nr:hypothetical protein CBF23_000230 [Marinomonas agarivorans]